MTCGNTVIETSTSVNFNVVSKMFSTSNPEDLGRSSLEYIDPTPDVHRLFCTFNDMFFYGKLDSVSVRWSKRMYSCAGICRYQQRIGFCDIALSEPLLKLRSRKDLIETLIHEMIHAYLFVTMNNRDRDGHGPEFLSHMHRINKRANLNISVYHSFHSEVNLYKTHWWRCDGPCQKRKPFYGTVRRSMNRAPGPNDFWWKEHQFTCGGKFIKIKEPEKKLKPPVPPKKILTPKNNLDKYFKEKTKDFTDGFTIGNSGSNSLDNGVKKENKKSIVDSNDNPRDAVRNHWASKYANDNPRDAVRNHWASQYPSTKRKIDESLSDTENLTENNSKRVKQTCHNDSIPTHVQLNLSKEEFDDYNAILQDVYGGECSLNTSNYKPKVTSFSKSSEPSDTDSKVPCPICNKKFVKLFIESHVNQCLDSLPSDEIDLTQDQLLPSCTSTPLPSTSKRRSDNIEKAKCPLCSIDVSDLNMEQHLDNCVSGTFLQESKVVFNESISSSKSEELVTLITDDDSEDENIGSKVPCPCCLMLYEHDKINEHIDDCLL